MTPFTDDDLKRLKKKLEQFGNIDVCNFFEDNEEIEAIISRLEAAERALTMFLERKIKLPKENYWCIEAWRQSAGKDKV